jgi:mannose-6-phosphate isomerase
LRHPQFYERFLIACQYFVLTLCVIDQRSDELTTNGRLQILSFIEGAANIFFGSGLASSVAVKPGQTLVLPARLGAYALAPVSPCKILRAFVPNLNDDLITPLTQAGFDAATIARLGGAIAGHNDLVPLLSV